MVLRFVRKECIEKLDKSLTNELEFVRKIIHANAKTYQAWEHRRWLIKKIGNPLDEIKDLETLFQMDNKNYHAWGQKYQKS